VGKQLKGNVSCRWQRSWVQWNRSGSAAESDGGWVPMRSDVFGYWQRG